MRTPIGFAGNLLKFGLSIGLLVGTIGCAKAADEKTEARPAAPAMSRVATPVQKSQPTAAKLSNPKPPQKNVDVNKGLMVFIDPVTGQMREPTAEELRALTTANTAASSAKQAVQPGSANIQGADGSPGMTLGPDSMIYTVVTRTPEGLKMEEVTGERAAAERVKAGKSEEPKRGK